jgi:signal transduction histidine kinase
MRTLRFRAWYVLVLLGTVLVVAQLTRMLASVETSPQRDTTAVRAAATAIIGGSASWSDPAWQRAMDGRLDALRVDAVITSDAGQVVYRHGTGLITRSPSSTDTVVAADGRTIGSVAFYGRTTGASRTLGSLIQVAEALLVLLLLVGGGWFVGRTILRPLAIMSQAAPRIAAGDLDIQIPASRVREVAAVGAAFAEMADGLRAARERQATLEQERTLFIAAIAHDLRTPLFALRARLEGLERGVAATPEQAVAYIRVAREKADSLERLIADLFAYTRLEYLEQSLQETDVDIDLLMGEALEGVRAHAEAKGVMLRSDGSEAVRSLRGDPHLLARAIGNLLDNAVRFTPPGGRIALRWRRRDDRLIFEVADTGPGIAPSDLPHLFEPLYRGDISRNTRTGGVGLGLTIARRIVRAHGGDLTITNRPHGGAVFRGTIPVAGAAPGNSPEQIQGEGAFPEGSPLVVGVTPRRIDRRGNGDTDPGRDCLSCRNATRQGSIPQADETSKDRCPGDERAADLGPLPRRQGRVILATNHPSLAAGSFDPG